MKQSLALKLLTTTILTTILAFLPESSYASDGKDWKETYAEGVAFRKAKSYEQARDCFAAIVMAEPSDLSIKAMHNLGSVACAMKKYDEAYAWFAKANKASLEKTGEAFAASASNMAGLEKDGLAKASKYFDPVGLLLARKHNADNALLSMPEEVLSFLFENMLLNDYLKFMNVSSKLHRIARDSVTVKRSLEVLANDLPWLDLSKMDSIKAKQPIELIQSLSIYRAMEVFVPKQYVSTLKKLNNPYISSITAIASQSAFETCMKDLTPEAIDLHLTYMNEDLKALMARKPETEVYVKLRKKWFYQAAHDEKFYGNVKPYVRVANPRGAGFHDINDQKQVLYSVSYEMMVKGVQDEALDVLKRGNIYPNRPLDEAQILELHQNFVEYLAQTGGANAQGENRPITLASIMGSNGYPAPEKPVIFYKSILNAEGIEELQPTLYIPPTMRHDRGWTKTLYGIPEQAYDNPQMYIMQIRNCTGTWLIR